MSINSLRSRMSPLVIVFATQAVFAGVIRAESPRVFLWDASHLQNAREQIAHGDKQLQPALESLRRDADRALEAGPFSVVNKNVLPPSGDKHDYMSFAPYWWPNPKTSNGVPYIQRDGERNPEIYKISNRHDLGELSSTVETLALAYYFTGDEKYAARTRLLIRTWFLERDTRMNPNFQFAQAIRGINTGRGLGLIESRLFTNVVNAIGLLADSREWTKQDQQEIENWFTVYLNWMLTSTHGREEARAANNHGTYYDIQIATFALFLRNNKLAAEVVETAKTKRIATQIEPDGRQPLELVRTKAWSYSLGNLSGLMSLAKLGEQVDVDLWHYKTADGRSIRAALDFLVPFGMEEEKWPYKQIDGFSRDAIGPLIRRAAAKYPDGPYRRLLLKFGRDDIASRSRLLFSSADSANQSTNK